MGLIVEVLVSDTLRVKDRERESDEVSDSCWVNDGVGDTVGVAESEIDIDI